MPPRFGRARSTREPPDPRLRRSQLGSSARRHHRIFMSGRRVMPCQVMLRATRRRKSSQRWRITPPSLRQSNTGLRLSKRGRRLHIYISALTCASSWILSFSAYAGTLKKKEKCISNHLTTLMVAVAAFDIFSRSCINQQRLFITQRKSSLVGLSHINQRHTTCRRSCRMSQIADTNVSRQANLPKTNIADTVIWTTVDVYTELPWSKN